RTTPPAVASTGISIFMDSRMTTTSPSFTLSPTLTSIFQTVPVMCAQTSLAMIPRGAARLRLLAWLDRSQLDRDQRELERDRQPVLKAVPSLAILREQARAARHRVRDDGPVAVAAGVDLGHGAALIRVPERLQAVAVDVHIGQLVPLPVGLERQQIA